MGHKDLLVTHTLTNCLACSNPFLRVSVRRASGLVQTAFWEISNHHHRRPIMDQKRTRHAAEHGWGGACQQPKLAIRSRNRSDGAVAMLLCLARTFALGALALCGSGRASLIYDFHIGAAGGIDAFSFSFTLPSFVGEGQSPGFGPF